MKNAVKWTLLILLLPTAGFAMDDMNKKSRESNAKLETGHFESKPTAVLPSGGKYYAAIKFHLPVLECQKSL